METVTISLNGREVAGSAGTTILDLAKQAGVDIPTLCHHPLLRSAGACRVCLVEDVKSGRLLASCVTPISQGMEIMTHSSAAVSGRRDVLELILSDHPSACVVCSKGNECVLRTLAKEHGICDPEIDPLRRWRPVQEVNPFVVRDLTKCVLCGRCIRMCKEFEAVGAIEYMDRGYESHPGTSGDTALEGSECNFCGSCVGVCPTDALAERDRISISSGHTFAAGVCSYCGTGCRLDYELADGVVVGARGIPGSPVNGLSLCVRGHYGQDALASPARLSDPLIRDDEGSFAKSAWDEALAEVAHRLMAIVSRYGPSSVGVIAGTDCTNEEFYLAARFARSTVGTPHVDSTARLSSGALEHGLAMSFKRGRPPGSLKRILEADTICLLGARPDYTHPVVARNIRQAVRNKGAALIQFDELRTSLSPFARIRFKEDTNHLPQLMMQLMRELVINRLQHDDFLQSHVQNADEFFSRVQLEKPVVRADIEEAIRLMAKDRKLVFLLGSMLARSIKGVILARLAANLAFLCGQPESIFALFQGSNELGAWDMGCSPDRLPGGLPLEDPKALETLRDAWQSEISVDRGLDAMEMIRAAEEGKLRALVFLGVDPLTSFPDTERTRKALDAMDLVVRTAMFPAGQQEVAEFVFPATAITEADGTYTNIEGRVQRVSKIADPPGTARPNARFLVDLAGRMGTATGFLTAKDVFEEIRTVCPAWADLSWRGVGRPGGLRLPIDGDQHAEAVGQLSGSGFVAYVPSDSFVPAPEVRSGHPWKIFPEERLAHPGYGVVSGRSFRLARFAKEDVARINPGDASTIRVFEGQRVLLRTDVGQVKLRLMFDSAVPRMGIVVPSGGPRYLLERLLSWSDEGQLPGWDGIFASVELLEE